MFISPRQYLPVLLLSLPSAASWAVGLEDMKLAANWECKVITEQDDIWLKTYFKGQPQFDYRIGAGGSIAEMRSLKGKKPQALLAPSPYGRLADQQVQWTAIAQNLSRKLPNVPASGWQYQVAQGVAYDNLYVPTVAVLVKSSGCQVDVFSIPKEQYRPEQRTQWQGSFPNLTSYRIVGAGALALRQVVRISGARVEGKPAALTNLRLQTSLPLAKNLFNTLGLGLDTEQQPRRSFGIGTSLPAFADWKQDKSDPLLLAYDAKGLADKTGLLFGGSSQAPCRQSDTGCEDFGEQRLNLFEASNSLNLLPSTLLPSVTPGDMLDQTLLLYPHYGLQTLSRPDLNWLLVQIPRPRLVPAGQQKAAGLSVIAAKLAFFEDTPGLRSNHLARALNLNNLPQQLTQANTGGADDTATYYRLSAVSSSQLLDIADASLDDGAPSLQSPFRSNAARHQRWSLSRDVSGNFSIGNQFSGKCLEAEDSSKKPGIQVQQFSCHNGSSQKWTLRPLITGQWEIMATSSNLCLDAAGGSREAGAAMQLWPCNGRDQQKWVIDEVDHKGKPTGRRFHPFSEGAFSGPRLTQGSRDNRYWTTSAVLPASYGSLGSWGLAAANSNGARPVYECRNGDNNFLSLDAGCENQTYTGITDWLYATPVPGALPLYRCKQRESGAYFVANNRNCDGQTLDKLLGFVMR